MKFKKKFVFIIILREIRRVVFLNYIFSNQSQIVAEYSTFSKYWAYIIEIAMVVGMCGKFVNYY